MSDLVSTGGGLNHPTGCTCPFCTSTAHTEPATLTLDDAAPPGDHWVVFERDDLPELWYGPYTSEKLAVAALDSVEVNSICEDTDSDEVIDDVFTAHQSRPPGGAEVLYGTDEHYNQLNRDMAVGKLFPDYRDAEQALEFEFDWNRIDHDDDRGYVAHDSDDLGIDPASKTRVGDLVTVPDGTAPLRVIKVVTSRRREGPPPFGRIVGTTRIWTEGQDPSTDLPQIACDSDADLEIVRGVPKPGLQDPVVFNGELQRRVYEKTANYSSRADEPHDVERTARGLVDTEATQLASEVLAARTDASCPERCCTSCNGTGTSHDAETNGRCWDCRGTGHAHA